MALIEQTNRLWRGMKWAIIGVLPAILTLMGWLAFPLLWPAAVTARYQVRVDLEAGRADVEAELSNLRHPLLPLVVVGDGKQMALTHFEARGEGNASKGLWGYRSVYFVMPGLAERIFLKYGVRLGVRGRHGYQGRIEKEMALLPTRLLMWLPAPPWLAREVLLRVQTATGDEVMANWPQGTEGWYEARLSDLHPYSLVLGGVVAVGGFDTTTFETNGQRLVVAIHRDIAPEWQRGINARTHAIFAHLQRRLDFQLQRPYTAIFVPRASNGRKIFGNYGPLGTAYEIEPFDRRRYELFAHRLTHVFNRDAPYGLTMGRLRDRWFYEGLASWMEVSLIRAAKVASGDDRLHLLFKRYWRRREKWGNDYDLPPRADWHQWDLDHIEWLHYTKYPLVVQMLDYTLRRAGGAGWGVEPFFAHLYKRYGQLAEPVPDLRQELEAFTGRDWAGFFARYVDDNWPLLPVWGEGISKAMRRAKTKTVLAHLGGLPVYSDLIFAELAEKGSPEKKARAYWLLRYVAAGQAIGELQLQDVPVELVRVAAFLRPYEMAAVYAHRRRALGEALDLDKDELDAWLTQRLGESGVVWSSEFAELGD